MDGGVAGDVGGAGERGAGGKSGVHGGGTGDGGDAGKENVLPLRANGSIGGGHEVAEKLPMPNVNQVPLRRSPDTP